MSDAKPGDQSPNRPETNTEHAEGEALRASPKQKKEGRSRRRWKRRRKNPQNGIPVDKQMNKTSSEGANGLLAGAARQAEHELLPPAIPDISVLGAPKDSKRRRRRRGKKGKAQHGKHQPCAIAETDAGQSSSASIARQSPSIAGKANRLARKSNHRRPPDPRPNDQPRDTAAEAANKADLATESSRRSKSKNWNGQARQRPHANAYAALDLGTNNCRLLIAVPQQPGRFRVIDAFSRIVRLGEGLAASGQLREDAMDRAIGALKICASKLKNRRVKNVRLIATEACRRAENGAEFLDRVEQQTGIRLEIIDRETEARLAVQGCASLVDRKARGVVLFDIGGGSSELALLDLNKRRRHDLGPAMVSWTSLPVGVVTLSERHGGGRLVTRPVFEAMVEDVSAMLSGYDGRDALNHLADKGEVHLLGTSGTVTTLAGIHLELPRYDRRRVDGTWMSATNVDAMINRLVDMSYEQRAANPCIGQDRADLVLAGCAILVAIQRLWPCPRLRVADRGLREGLLTQMMNADNAWQRRPRYYRSNRG